MVISRKFKFEASHVLPLHSGKCSRLHGHSYFGELRIAGDINPATGMVLDFSELDKFCEEEIVNVFDHRNVNDVMLAREIPGQATAEVLARYLLDRAILWFGDRHHGVAVQDVVLHETANCAAHAVNNMRYDEEGTV